ncbi:MAG: hypothetical protein D6830_02810 [Ignavibacteria bacterium]|nr:MAG: hypothetical protein D6830_02810 [Ignavibacteria bacterium]
MKQIRKQIWQITEKSLEDSDFLLIDLVVRGSANAPVFEIFVDSPNGISTEDCSSISRLIHEQIEHTDIAKTKYRLDVSSPGIDRPLKYLEQYPKNIGREFQLEYEENGEIIKTDAVLNKVENGKLEFSNKNNLIVIEYNQIKKAKVKISF